MSLNIFTSSAFCLIIDTFLFAFINFSSTFLGFFFNVFLCLFKTYFDKLLCLFKTMDFSSFLLTLILSDLQSFDMEHFCFFLSVYFHIQFCEFVFCFVITEYWNWMMLILFLNTWSIFINIPPALERMFFF